MERKVFWVYNIVVIIWENMNLWWEAFDESNSMHVNNNNELY